MKRYNETDFAGSVHNGSTILYKEKTSTDRIRWVCLCHCGVIFKSTICRDSKLERLECENCSFSVYAGQENIEAYGRTRLFNIWKGMRYRCNNPKNNRYKNYGARGITVCKEWNLSFLVFRSWALSNGYEDHLTLEREDTNGNYCPENCTWLSKSKQTWNRSTTVRDISGKSASEFYYETPNPLVSYVVFYRRISDGMGWEKAISTPPKKSGTTKEYMVLSLTDRKLISLSHGLDKFEDYYQKKGIPPFGITEAEFELLREFLKILIS